MLNVLLLLLIKLKLLKIMLQIYNTLKNQKEDFLPLNPPNVTIYVCGPTVYDYFHIGNARSFINSDLIRRYLEFKGYNVKFVMNLTDIDDKIIKKANAEGIPFSEVTGKYSNAFFEDIKKLKIKPANVYPKATEHIGDIIALISKLIENGFAYNIDGNVFYDVAKFSGYGKLSGKNTDDLEVGARVELNEEKRNPLDFSLWKRAKENEPYWESPFGNGRPGWHIECSAMSCKHLGETFDIHAGGSDLIFPHHENEIAQSEAATGKQFARYWMHFGFLNINEEKMSKSLGNFFTARDILKIYPAETIRMFLFQTHYASPLNFSDEAILAAQKGLEKIDNLVLRIKEGLTSATDSESIPDFSFDKFYNDFTVAMDDDFNSPKAIAVIFDFVKEANRALADKSEVSKRFYEELRSFIEKTAIGVLGITDFDKQTDNKAALAEGSGKENELIELLIDVRNLAKKEKNFSLADKIRDDLKAIGFLLQDTKEKTTYKKA